MPHLLQRLGGGVGRWSFSLTEVNCREIYYTRYMGGRKQGWRRRNLIRKNFFAVHEYEEKEGVGWGKVSFLSLTATLLNGNKFPDDHRRSDEEFYFISLDTTLSCFDQRRNLFVLADGLLPSTTSLHPFSASTEFIFVALSDLERDRESEGDENTEKVFYRRVSSPPPFFEKGEKRSILSFPEDPFLVSRSGAVEIYTACYLLAP